DVDQLSVFMQWGGVLGLVSVGQLVVATVVMSLYSWQLTLLVLICFIPLAVAVRWFAKRLAASYGIVRERVGDVLGAVAESVVGAPTVRAYGVGARTANRIDTAIDRQYRAQVDAQKVTAAVFVSGEFVAALANAAVVVVGVLLGLAGEISAGTLVAFLFLVTLFVAPVQTASEVLNEAQNAVAGFRRVLDVIDTEADIRDPAIDDPAGVRELPGGPLGVRFDHVSFRYAPGAPKALDGVDLTVAPRLRVAIVGETGSGKTTFAKLVTRLMDPVAGRVLLGSDDAGWVPLDEVGFASLRSRVVMVPQDGFLFDSDVAGNVRYGRPGMTDAEVAAAFAELGLGDWVAGLDQGVATAVGQRGESLSAGERQLVAIARAYVADPDLLVLDEATSAVDPATEQRLTRALDTLTDGRTTLTIAHRLSTAERADEVLVVDAGHVVQRGTHAELVDAEGPYARLHASWRRSSAGEPTPAA
ncbi:MAG: putative ABC-type multidrug transport system, ATPase and permease component, partial [Blastococcus sp.]|nr:putative ABC-type multidrug transport system, ATPase and permease component [Blastococcus sp.]